MATEKKQWLTPLPDTVIIEKTMDEIDNVLSVAILHYCAWNRGRGYCDKDESQKECERCPANALLDIVFNGDRDVIGEWEEDIE